MRHAYKTLWRAFRPGHASHRPAFLRAIQQPLPTMIAAAAAANNPASCTNIFFLLRNYCDTHVSSLSCSLCLPLAVVSIHTADKVTPTRPSACPSAARAQRGGHRSPSAPARYLCLSRYATAVSRPPVCVRVIVSCALINQQSTTNRTHTHTHDACRALSASVMAVDRTRKEKKLTRSTLSCALS